MENNELVERVRELRRQGRPSKAIARTLGFAPADVAPIIRAVAAEEQGDAPMAPVAGCWVNPGWSVGLSVEPGYDWPDTAPADSGAAGLVSVVVARAHRGGKAVLCCYLVDVYCLGVKNVVGPRVLKTEKVRGFLRDSYSGFGSGPQPAPLELAQHLVFGAMDYARSLGFEPMHGFTGEVVEHLGEWEGPSPITFGQDGKPFFVAGPNDDPNSVIKTLKRSVGKKNFDYVAGVPGLG